MVAKYYTKNVVLQDYQFKQVQKQNVIGQNLKILNKEDVVIQKKDVKTIKIAKFLNKIAKMLDQEYPQKY